MNGHRPVELARQLAPITISAKIASTDEVAFDLDKAAAAVVPIHADIPSDAHTAAYLGTEREGSGVLIDDAGLVLTIGYLMLESRTVTVTANDGRIVATDFVAYDSETGFGLVRAREPLVAEPLSIGSAAALREGEPVLIAARGGRRQTIVAAVVSRREFAGYWEYLLDEAIFTAPPHPNWSGAALIDTAGRLCGLGSLLVDDAVAGDEHLQGNMFVPIDLLAPVLGRSAGEVRPPRPWLGMFTAETLDQLVVTHVTAGGPASRAGIRAGDVVVRVNGVFVAKLAELYRQMWSLGPAGVEIPLTVLRDSTAIELRPRSVGRNDFFRTPRE